MKRGLSRYRRRIDRLDRRVSRLLARRFFQVLRIGNEKREKNAEVTDEAREREVLDRVGAAVKNERARGFVHAVYRRIIEESVHAQREEERWTDR